MECLLSPQKTLHSIPSVVPVPKSLGSGLDFALCSCSLWCACVVAFCFIRIVQPVLLYFHDFSVGGSLVCSRLQQNANLLRISLDTFLFRSVFVMLQHTWLLCRGGTRVQGLDATCPLAKNRQSLPQKWAPKTIL